MRYDDSGNILPFTRETRAAVAYGHPRTIERYLPGNYHIEDVINEETLAVLICGHDVAGWTLDGYVLPRLASGLIFGEEVSP